MTASASCPLRFLPFAWCFMVWDGVVLAADPVPPLPSDDQIVDQAIRLESKTYPIGGFWEFDDHAHGLAIVNGDGGQSHLVSDDGDTPTLILRRCANVHLRGLRIGHDPARVPRHSCGAPALWLEDCTNVLIDGCDLYGCGTEGVHALGVKGIEIRNTVIHDCTIGMAYLAACTGVSFKSCLFRDNELCGAGIIAAWSGDILIEDCGFRDNTLLVQAPLLRAGEAYGDGYFRWQHKRSDGFIIDGESPFDHPWAHGGGESRFIITGGHSPPGVVVGERIPFSSQP